MLFPSWFALNKPWKNKDKLNPFLGKKRASRAGYRDGAKLFSRRWKGEFKIEINYWQITTKQDEGGAEWDEMDYWLQDARPTRRREQEYCEWLFQQVQCGDRASCSHSPRLTSLLRSLYKEATDYTAASPQTGTPGFTSSNSGCLLQRVLPPDWPLHHGGGKKRNVCRSQENHRRSDVRWKIRQRISSKESGGGTINWTGLRTQNIRAEETGAFRHVTRHLLTSWPELGPSPLCSLNFLILLTLLWAPDCWWLCVSLYSVSGRCLVHLTGKRQ